MKDFTLHIYQELLLAITEAGYTFFTFENWCDGKAKEPFVILRHDVDLKADHSLAMAQLEAEMGIKASYYFRVVPQSNQPEIIRSIAKLGHEIGYHYEDLSLFKGDEIKALQHFEQQLHYFRQFYPIRTICMHGSPISKWDNRDLWKTHNYQEYGIVGEPYFDFLSTQSLEKKFESDAKADLKEKAMYFTDTGRMWNGDKYNVRDIANQPINQSTDQPPKIHSTFDLINWLNTKPNQQMIMITTHPQRWTTNKSMWMKELFFQTLKNNIKRFIVRRTKFV